MLDRLTQHWDSHSSGIIRDPSIVNAYAYFNTAVQEDLPDAATLVPLDLAPTATDTRVIISTYWPDGRARITRVSGVMRPAGLGDLRSPVVRHEALLLPNGGERPPSPCRRSGGVKLEAA